MEEYGKVFRHKDNNSFTLRPYNPDDEKYFELINLARIDGYNQLIINSELMVSVIYSTLEKSGELMKLTMSDNTDQDIKDNVKFIIGKLKHDKLLFVKLKTELEWAIDSGSIDVNSADVYFEKNRYTIYSNGIIYGREIKSYYKKIIAPMLESYFNDQ